MKPSEAVFNTAIITIAIVLAVVSNLPGVALLNSSLIVAVVVYFGYRSPSALSVVAVLLILSDLFSLNPVGSSLAAFAIMGLIVSLLAKVVPLLKQQPFWLGRNLWLGGALFLNWVLNSGLSSSFIGLELSNFLLSLVLSLLGLNLLTFIAQNVYAPANYGDITIT